MNNIKFAPIALFTYNRADHTKSAVESLLRNVEASQSDLFVFSDAAKKESQAENVKLVRDYVHEIVGFKSGTVISKNV